uniref:Uncharacterized protein n=1 Tax=Oryza barthii TaxID=65489 RepID=A0A0D3GIZ5_9ORYZ
MASRDGNGGGLDGFVWSYHGGDEGIMVLMCSALLRLEPIGRLAQANSAPELHQARRGGRSLRDWWSGNIRSKSGVEATSDGKKDPIRDSQDANGNGIWRRRPSGHR